MHAFNRALIASLVLICGGVLDGCAERNAGDRWIEQQKKQQEEAGKTRGVETPPRLGH